MEKLHFKNYDEYIYYYLKKFRYDKVNMNENFSSFHKFLVYNQMNSFLTVDDKSGNIGEKLIAHVRSQSSELLGQCHSYTGLRKLN